LLQLPMSTTPGKSSNTTSGKCKPALAASCTASAGNQTKSDELLQVPMNTMSGKSETAADVNKSANYVFRVVPVVGGVRRDPSSVAAAFSHLRVPEVKSKNKQVTMRSKLPKALSGSAALEMMRKREEDKRVAEEQKVARKEERENKKREREEEKERKKRERENAKKVKLMVKEKKRGRSMSGKGDCHESKENVPYMDVSDEEFDERTQCPGCLSSEGLEDEWISCFACKRGWHIECCEREEFYWKTKGDLVNVEYLCDLCFE